MENLCRPGGPDSTCFQPVLSLVAAYLEVNHFKPFLASALYNNYVKELIAMIQASPRSLNSVQASLSTARTESDTRSSCSSSCSSDRLPRSTSNTLLASSSGQRSSTSFDCGELQDPDSIWRRRPVKNKVIGHLAFYQHSLKKRDLRIQDPEPFYRTQVSWSDLCVCLCE